MASTLDPPHRTPREAGLDLVCPARAEQVGVARHEVDRLARAAGLSDEVRRDVALVVSEACANVVVHAYAAGPRNEADRVLLVHAEVVRDALCVEVADRGAGMAPRHDSPGMGLGLPLMASLTDELEVRETGEGGTTLRFVFRARARAAATDRRVAGRSAH